MHLHSLHPYLDPAEAQFCLKLPLVAEDASILEKALFPFVVISDSDPLTHLIEARFVTDAGHMLKKVFLLVQRDRYRLGKDELWPINNHDIDQSWQKAFSFYSTGTSNTVGDYPRASDRPYGRNHAATLPVFLQKETDLFSSAVSSLWTSFTPML